MLPRKQPADHQRLWNWSQQSPIQNQAPHFRIFHKLHPQQPDKKSSLLKYVVATILIAIVLVTLTLLWQRPKVYQVDVDYGTSITSRIESLDEELFECNDFQVPQNARDLDIIPEQIGQQTTIIKLIHLRAFGNGGGNITVEALLSEIDRKGFALLLLKRLYSYTSNIDRPNLYLHHSGRMPLGQFYIQMLSWVLSFFLSYLTRFAIVVSKTSIMETIAPILPWLKNKCSCCSGMTSIRSCSTLVTPPFGTTRPVGDTGSVALRMVFVRSGSILGSLEFNCSHAAIASQSNSIIRGRVCPDYCKKYRQS